MLSALALLAAAGVVTGNPVPQAPGACPGSILGGLDPRCNDYYTVAPGDWCVTITAAKGISLSDLYAWNPTIHNPSCDNLVPGCAYCTGITPDTGNCPTNVLATCTTQSRTLVAGDICINLVSEYGITLADFYAWNPEVHNPSCDNLQIDCTYCVDGTTPADCPPLIPGCVTPYHVAPGEWCQEVADNAGISLATFYALNPTIDTNNCPNLLADCDYCVEGPPSPTIPSPHEADTRTGCTWYYQAVAGDNCWDLTQGWGIDNNAFMSWNPTLLPACLNMKIGYYYCAGI